MKKRFLLSMLLGSAVYSHAQNVGIGTNTPNASAKLDIVDANRGLLIPRVALTATNSASPVAAPATSLLVYNTATAGSGGTAVTPGFYYWTGTAWSRFAAGNASWELLGNTGTVATTNFIGTTDAVDFVTRTSNTERMRVTSAGNVGIGTSTPAAKLHVASGAIRPEAGNVTAAGIHYGADIYTGSGDEAYIRYYQDGGTEDTRLIIANQNDAADDILVEAGAITLRTGDGVAIPDADRLTVTTAGNIGINTTTPAERLHVVGNVRTSSLAGTGVRIVGSDANGTLANIAAGTNGQILTMVAGAPAWNTPSIADWTLLGNAGTVATTNFIGTTDAVDFVTRTSNTERMRVTSAGNVGIGTSTPAAKLHVASGAIRPEAGNVTAAGIHYGADIYTGSGDEAYIRYYQDGGTEDTRLIIANQNDAADDILVEAGAITLRTGDGVAIPDADRLTVTTAGNIGINTTTPAERLHVVGNVRTSSLAGTGVRIVGSDANGTLTNITAGTNGQILTMVAGAPAWAAPAVTDWTLLGNAGTDPNTNFIGTTDAIDFVTRTNNAERMRVTSAGNVGINTASPITSLHVVGDAFLGSSAAVSSTYPMAGARLGFGGGAGINTDDIFIQRYYSASDYATLRVSIGDNNAGDDKFEIGNGAWTPWFTVVNTGNVGIGNTSPAEKLHVVGNVRTSSLAGTGTRIVGSDANGTLTNIAAGTNGQILTMVAGAPAWAANSNWTLTGNSGTNAASNFIGTADAVDFVARTSNVERMRIAAGGNVGIGNTSPAAKLHISGGAIRPEVGNVAAAGIHFGADVYGGGLDEAYIRYYQDGTGEDTRLVIANQNDAADDIQIEAGSISLRTGDGGVSVPDADRLFITTGGNVGIGTTTPAMRLTVNGGRVEIGNAGDNIIYSRNDAQTIHHELIGTYMGWDQRAIYLGGYNVNNASGAYAGANKIYCGGSFGTLPIYATAFNTTSSRRYKQNIVPVAYGLSAIMRLRPVQYQYNFEKSGVTHVGLIAEEVDEVVPEVVVKHNDQDEQATTGKAMGINYQELVPVLVKGMQEQQAIIEQQQKQLDALQKQVDALLKKN